MRAFVVPAQLRDRSLLLIGGMDRSGHSTRVDRYDPFAKTWQRTTDLPKACFRPSATTLDDGRVLVAGGLTDRGEPSSATYLYDPARDTWSTCAPLVEARSDHAVARLTDGRVVVCGGRAKLRERTSIEAFDPETLRWTRVGQLGVPRTAAAANVLPDGRVLVSGGTYTTPQGSAELFGHRDSTEIWDPKRPQTVVGPPMTVERSRHHVVEWPSGRVLLIGGDSSIARSAGPAIRSEWLEP